jgi:hypothetical protein
MPQTVDVAGVGVGAGARRATLYMVCVALSPESAPAR